MEQFDINKIVEHYGLNINDVAAALFPHVRYKKQALDRILRGEAFLDTSQLQMLAKLAGIFPQDLFSINDWHGGSEDKCLTFVKGDYKVKLNYKNVYLTLYKNNIPVYQEVTMPHMEISEFINYITKLIKKF